MSREYLDRIYYGKSGGKYDDMTDIKPERMPAWLKRLKKRRKTMFHLCIPDTERLFGMGGVVDTTKTFKKEEE